MSVASYKTALAAMGRARTSLRDARIEAETAAEGLCAARASRCLELARMVAGAYELAERILFVLEADISSAQHELDWERSPVRNERKPS